MSRSSPPRVSVGLPVYDGEEFVGEAIASILGQTHRDLELVVCDNASSDGTEAICRAFAARDPRVRFVRNERNIGAAGNYNRVLSLASGEYFKWAAHDDVCRPGFFSRCVEALDGDPRAALAYTAAIRIDAGGRESRSWRAAAGFGSDAPHERFREALAPWEFPLPLFGLIRTSVLRTTSLYAGYPGCDRALLAELSLRGPFAEIPEALFLQRTHARSAGPQLHRDLAWAAGWWNTARSGRPGLPEWRLLRGYLDAVRQAPLPGAERARCLGVLGPWIVRQREPLLRDLVAGLGRLPAIGPSLARGESSLRRASWERRRTRASREIEALVPAGARLILVDDATLACESLGGRRTLPFLERDGRYFGSPADDETAIRELERMEQGGAGFLVFAWPAFWWLEHYPEFHAHLRSRFRCILHNERLVVFDLRAGAQA